MRLLLASVGPLLPLLAWPALSPARRVLLALVALVGGVAFRYAHRALDRHPGRDRFERWFLATLGAATVVVAVPDLIVAGLAWTATSLALHRLLTFETGRPAAEVAAHQKFLLSRGADVLLVAALALIARTFGTTHVPTLLETVARTPALPAAAEWAGVLLVGAVIVRSAQLPFHGWLLQVMEAPTPVSALLHAGIVNLGAILLLTVAPFLDRLTVAPLLLVGVGGVTAALGALAMLTRGSIKAQLAWSTTAQMGFLLLTCGLGAWDLALVHLVGHALYKAHAFLASGGTPGASRRIADGARPDATAWSLALATACTAVGAVAAIGWGDVGGRPALALSALLLALGIATALAPGLAGPHRSLRTWGATLPLALGLPAAYGLVHPLAAAVAPGAAAATVPPAVLLVVAWGAIGLFVVQGLVTARPDGRLARALYPHAAAGFHLDLLFTRLTFRLWPPTIPARRPYAVRATDATSITRAA